MTAHLELRRLINLPAELIEALGHVSLRYGQIEHLLTMTIHRTTGLSYSEAYAEVEGLGRPDHRKKAKRPFRDWAVREFGESNGNKCAEAFDNLIQNWPALYARRDDVIHCCWSVGIEDKQLSGTRRGKPLEWDGRPVRIEDVQKLADNLKQFVVRLNTATMPDQLSGPENEIATMPPRFSVNYIMPAHIETSATAEALFAATEQTTKPSDD